MDEMHRPKVKLIGEDGNAFMILGKTIRALRKAGYPQAEIDRYRNAATSGDYDHLLGVTMEWVDVE
jgi:hypothetical protein